MRAIRDEGPDTPRAEIRALGIGHGWKSATVVSVALLVADEATGPNAPLAPF